MHSFFKNKTLASFVDNGFLIDKYPEAIKTCLITQKPLFKLSMIKKNEINQAIFSSQNSFLSYKWTTPLQREKLLHNAKDLLLKNKNELAKLITQEMGKTITEAQGEVEYAASYFEYYSDQIAHTLKQTTLSKNSQKHLYSYSEPIGVCGLITPWNFPLAMPARKISAALAAGCTCLIKPSPETPCTMLFFAEILKEAGFPSGSVQVLIGDEKKIGNALFSSSLIKKLSFTGSTSVGKLLYKSSADTLKKLSLELGGLAPFIVLEDADIEKAAKEAVLAKFRNSGQTCVGASYFLIQENVFEKFTEAFIKNVKKLNIGDPLEPATEFSPHLHFQSEAKAKDHIEDALLKGAKALLPTENPCHPQILVNCTKNMKIFSEETFSPVAALLSFSTLKEAITIANSTPFGLAAYLMTEDTNKAEEIIKELEFGMIGLNDGLFSSPEIPFGGVKESGFGREGGPHGLDEFLVTKAISQKF